MDISNLTMKGSVVPAAAKATGVAEANKPAAHGKSLPELGQVRLPSEKVQDGASASQLKADDLHKLVDQTNEVLLERFSDLKFTVSEGTDTNVIRIEDSETGELIRQIPSEEMLAIARALDEVKQGMMLEEKA